MTAPTIEEQIEFAKRYFLDHNPHYVKAILASLEKLQSSESQPVPVEPEIFYSDIALGVSVELVRKSKYDAMKSSMQLAQNDRDAFRAESEAMDAVFSVCCESLGKQVQPAFLPDEIDELKKRAEKAVAELKLAQEERDELRALNLVKELADKDREGLFAVGKELIAREKRAEKAETELKLAQLEANKNPCSCVADGDNGSVAHLCQWHKNQFGKAYKMQNMADSVTVENFTKLSTDKLRLFIAHGIQESTVRKKAESLNRRMVELLKEPSANMKSAGYGKPDYLAIFKAMSAELLKEVEK